jgi:phage terminase large subunit GpA-like protein
MANDPLSEAARPWLLRVISSIVDSIERKTPVEFNQDKRYLPQSVSPFPGFINFDVAPYWKEILNCFDPFSPIREAYVKKGVQVMYTTGLESILFYVAGHIKTKPCMFATADKDLSHARIENNILPMFLQSGLDVFQSADQSNAQKKGKTKNLLQWRGGGYMVPVGARNADKLKMHSIQWLLMDEQDAWLQELPRGGDPVKMIMDRCAAFWETRKIFGGSTPLLAGSSHIEKAFLRGDQRRINVRCLNESCRALQVLRWSGTNKEKNFKFGFKWDYTEAGQLDHETVRYECCECGHAHYEHDKPRLFAEGNYEWVPTATPVEPGIRSYHIPAFYSPAGIQPWSKCVGAWIDAWDVKRNVAKSPKALQNFYNHILGEPFEPVGGKVSFVMASAHRRHFYRRGEIPNATIVKYCESRVLLLVCAVDVHHNNLAVSVMGFTRGGNPWLIDYWRIEDNSPTGCESINSPVWAELAKIIEEKVYTADDGRKYPIRVTMVDAGFANATVVEFCARYEFGVIPILGRDTYTQGQKIQEFAEFKTQGGTTGFRIYVDYYKDRMGPVLRRDWSQDEGLQRPYQFNAPVDATDKELTELTREYLKEKPTANGGKIRSWHGPHGAENELWDLLIYSCAGLEIMARQYCIQYYGDEMVDWAQFWALFEKE